MLRVKLQVTVWSGHCKDAEELSCVWVDRLSQTPKMKPHEEKI